MPEEPKPAPEQPEPHTNEQDKKDEEIGDFITRHVLEKDSVFFEG